MQIVVRHCHFVCQVKVLKAVKALTLSDVVLGQYEGDPDGTTEDSKLSYLDDPTVPKGVFTISPL